MKKILAFFAAILIVGLLLMAYNAGIRHAVMTAHPFIVELPKEGDDYFQVFVDFDRETHEYRGNIY